VDKPPERKKDWKTRTESSLGIGGASAARLEGLAAYEVEMVYMAFRHS
jgi:hypothetical protein